MTHRDALRRRRRIHAEWDAATGVWELARGRPVRPREKVRIVAALAAGHGLSAGYVGEIVRGGAAFVPRCGYRRKP